MIHVSCIFSLYQQEKVYKNSIHVKVFFVKYCTFDSQNTTTYFDARTVGKQVIQSQFVRMILAAKYIKSLDINRDIKNVNTMKFDQSHSVEHNTSCRILTRAKFTVSNTNPPNMRFNIRKQFAVVPVKKQLRKTLFQLCDSEKKSKRTSNGTPLKRQWWKELLKIKVCK